jgi:AraC family ethanolamine operon transcriptional activator
MLVFPTEGELEASTTAGFDVITLSIKEEDLLRLANAMKLRNFVELMDSHEVFTCTRWDLDRLVSKVQKNYFQQNVVNPFLIYEIMVQLIELILAGKSRQHTTKAVEKHLHIVSTVEELILCSADTPLTVKEICKAIGTSERTLQYAFNDTYQISPKSYINAVRLNAVHKELMHTASSELKISDIANAWGFWHMGQFAADYRKLFGKLPSETIRC